MFPASVALYQTNVSTEKSYIYYLKREVLFYFSNNGRPPQVQSHIQLRTTEQNNRTLH